MCWFPPAKHAGSQLSSALSTTELWFSGRQTSEGFHVLSTVDRNFLILWTQTSALCYRVFVSTCCTMCRSDVSDWLAWGKISIKYCVMYLGTEKIKNNNKWINKRKNEGQQTKGQKEERGRQKQDGAAVTQRKSFSWHASLCPDYFISPVFPPAVLGLSITKSRKDIRKTRTQSRHGGGLG